MTKISPPTRFEKLLIEGSKNWPMQGLPAPIPMSPWQATSLLQKAIRRGDVPRTQIAVSSLLMSDPARFWRRLGVIAFEDVGVANLPLVGQVTVALRGKALRRSLGGDRKIAIGLATDFARSPKNRAADDLLCVLNESPEISDIKQRLKTLSLDQLPSIVSCCRDYTTRCVGADMFAINCNGPLHQVAERLLCASGVSPTVTWLAREGCYRTRTMLPLLVGLLTQQNGLKQPNPDDPMPEEVEIAGLPGWVLDMFTREGKAAIRLLLTGKSDVARFIRDTFPHAGRTQLMGEALFRVESGLLRNRHDGPLGQKLRSRMERECLGVDRKHANKMLDLTKRAIPELNECRRIVMEGQRHD